MAIDYSDWAAGDEEVRHFDTAPFDYDNARKQMLARIDRTTKQLNNEKVAPRGGKDFETLHNGGVHYRPTLNGHPVQLPGLPAEGVKIHRDKLLDRLKAFAKDVEAGHFNEALKDIFSRKSVDGVLQASSAGRATSSGKGGAGKPRQSSIAERADGLAHRIPASEPQPHPDYALNKGKTYWRSPEQQARDAASYASRSAGKTA